MAENERPTSFAKTVKGLHYEENALDRARALSADFHKEQEQHIERQKPHEAQRQGETEKQGSHMVKTDAPVLRPTPSGPMRQQDRQQAYAKLGKERGTEQKKIDAAKLAQQFKAMQGKTRDRDHER